MPKRQLDHSDLLILNILQKEGNINNKDLAKRIGLATATTLKRVRRLEELGLFGKCHRVVQLDKLGYRLLYHLKITLSSNEEEIDKIESFIRKEAAIISASRMKGSGLIDACYFRLILLLHSDENLSAWSRRLKDKTGLRVVVEPEEAEELIKFDQSQKLSHHDLSRLRSLEP